MCCIDVADPLESRKRIDTLLYLRVYANVMGGQMWAESEGGTKLPPVSESTETTG